MSESLESWLAELNPQQRAAVTHDGGPLLIVAGAGTGKTRTLACRVGYLAARGVPPERILLLTFTRRAADEMLRRAAAVSPLGQAAMKRVWGGTFHAMANRLLRLYAQPAGLPPGFTILDRSDAEDMLDIVRTDLKLAGKERRFPRKSTCMDVYSRRVNGNQGLEEVLKQEFPWCLAWQDELKALFREYVARKQAQALLDYDDLLLYWYMLLQDDALALALGGRFDHILVDEYQDTNPIQAGILAGMRRCSPDITVVGDDAQSIYRFRSATVQNMLDFPQQFPGSVRITLEQNYRSVQPVLDCANRVIARMERRYSKELWSERKAGQRPQLITCLDEDDQDRGVIARVLEHYEQGIALRRQAVLFRAASHSSSLELALGRAGIPFRKYGGLRFLETAHVKDLVSILKIAENPRDAIAWFRVLQLLNGIGPATAAAAFKHVADAGYNPDALRSFKGPPAARDELAGLATLLERLAADAEPSLQLEQVRAFYLPLLERAYADAVPRAADIEHLQQLAGRHDTRREFLTELVLDPPLSTGDLAGAPIKDEDWLVLSTIHSAKGLEWDAVYLIHAADGCLPSDMSTGSQEEIDEELRLTYVALTRARDYLYVLWPLRYYHRSAGLSDRHSYAQCCRFFTEEARETMDILSPRRGEAGVEPPAAAPTGPSIGDRLKDMWG